jgi:hypothetical protein
VGSQEAAATLPGYPGVSLAIFVNTTGAHTPMAVGFNPRGVQWSQDGTLALVVSDASLAVVDLTAATLAPTLIDIAEDPTDAPPAEEVVLSDDGGYAFVGTYGGPGGRGRHDMVTYYIYIIMIIYNIYIC